jgi:Ca2+-transporting ATPase
MKDLVDGQDIFGLTGEEAGRRLKSEGYNEIPSQKKRNIFSILFNVVKEPMLLLLVACGTIYLFLGDVGDAMMLMSFVFVVVGITFYQERKTERALEALRNLSSPRALVIRDGAQKRIAGREVVREDIIVLKEGDRVPADALVLSCSNLSVDESLLTGESLHVRKAEWDGKTNVKRPGGDDLPFVYSGTLVVQGRGIAKVTSVGAHTEMGKIGKALQTITEEDTLLQKETKRIVRDFSIIGAIFCILIIVIYGLTRGNWLEGILSGLTLGMAMLPEEFPVVLIIFLTLGAWRISRKQVLTRRLPVIETLGAATVLCVDKTGTLTLNSMQLTTLFAQGAYFDVNRKERTCPPEKFHNILEYSILASQIDPFDPIEREIKHIGESCLVETEHIHKDWKIVREYPLSQKLLAISHVWESPDKQNYVVAAKGAPEAIFDLCHLEKSEKDEFSSRIAEMAGNGLRILGVAQAAFKKTDLPEKQHDFGFEFVGLLGFVDPVRSTVPQAIKEAYDAGIRVIMITGDYPGTAQYIAKEIGLRNYEHFITGPELEAMNPLQLRESIKTINIFSRVVPEQKLAIVNALKANGEIVAMTGDGVNDAPALKSAHIGIAMGERGTDVAREASALVLLNDDFSSIVHAVRLGRRIFENLKKAVAFIFSVHIPIAGMALLPVLFKLPVVLMPAHIAFLELIIDPACSTVFESQPEGKGIMKRPPRNLKEPLFNRESLLQSLLQGISVLIIVFAAFLFAFYMGMPEDEARALSFSTMVFANIALIITNLSRSQNFMSILGKKNKSLWMIIVGALGALMLILQLPVLRSLFHFAALSAEGLIIAILGGVASLLWFEALKFLRNNWKK